MSSQVGEDAISSEKAMAKKEEANNNADRNQFQDVDYKNDSESGTKVNLQTLQHEHDGSF